LLSSSEDAKILAGGQSLISMMKLRLTSPKILIDINGLAELSGIREESDAVVIGALTRHDELSRNSTVRQKFPLLAEAAGAIADQQVRNRGTIGGSLAHADPTADFPTACTALEATIIARSVNGSRSIKCADFFKGYFTTSLQHDEVIHEVRVPNQPPRAGGAYLKATKGNNDFALVAVAAQLRFDANKTCKSANVILGGVAPVPVHAEETEGALINRGLNGKAIEESAQNASVGLSPPSDARASAKYRLEMARALTRRAVEIAATRAGGVS
jgi:carbon-monoxide dehydrogenase medium subunit